MRMDERGITLHQSDIKSHCLEQMRLKMLAKQANDPPYQTDAATVGTIVHSVIDIELNGMPFGTEADAVAWAAAEYVNVLEQYKAEGCSYGMGTFETHDKALRSLSWLVKSWYHSPERFDLMYNDHPDLQAEWSFDLKFCDVTVGTGKKKQVIPVYLAGQADLVVDNRVKDWKTASSEYKQWELQRWGRQPDVYTWAAAKSGLITPDRDGMYYFDFKVFVRRQEVRLPDTVTVKRGENHWAWLEVMINRLVTMFTLLGTETGWPLDDAHVLCSPKWCEFWEQCKGSLIDAEKGWT